MKYTEAIDYPGVESIKDNLEFYKEKFIQDTILVFRGANLSFEGHEKIQKMLGDAFGWYPNTTEGSISRYIEDHEHSEDRTETNKDEVVVSWHIEHPSYGNPIVAGLWNMLTFNIESNRGSTLFSDTSKIYKMLPEDDREFLDKCVVNLYGYSKDHMYPTKAVQPHWLTNEPIIRFGLDRIEKGQQDLYKFDNREPTKTESERFLAIANEQVIKEIINNEDLMIVHEWQQGDLVIPDLHKLAHAVRGGFSPKDRKFTGLWSYQSPT